MDREDLPVRMLMDLSAKDPSTRQTGEVDVKITMDYSDWGKLIT